MNNELKINMKLVSSDNINMKLEDKKVIEANMAGGVIEVDPIFVDSPAYTITYNDINTWNHKSNFSGNYNDLYNKPLIPQRTSELVNDSGYITKSVTNLENYTLTNALSNVAISGDYDDLLDKPIIPTDTSDLTNNAGFVTSNTTDLVNYTLSSDLAAVATSGSYNDLYNTPELANVATSGNYNDLINKPTLAVVASTGDYDDLLDKPTIPTKTSDLTNDSGFITISDIPTIPTKTSELTNDSGFITNSVNDLTNYTLSSNLSSVATSGSYNDLSNTPTIPTASTLNVYSTTEQIVGTWINSKPLYRRVLTLGALKNNGETTVSYDSTFIIQRFEVYVKNTTLNVKFTLPLAGNSYINCFDDGTNHLIKVQTSSDRTAFTDNYVIIEYTKTTD